MDETVQYTTDSKGYIDFSKGLMINEFQVRAQIGKGTFSKVMVVRDHSQNAALRALKIVRNVHKYVVAAKMELAALRLICKHDTEDTSFCIHMLKAFEWKGHPCFVFPLYGRSVYRFLSENKHRPFSYEDTKQLAYQIITAITFLHKLNIVFTDLKPENIVFENDNPIKLFRGGEVPSDLRIRLVDFGSTVFDSGWHTHLVQTRHYRAPEVVMRTNWTRAIDLWSVGCVCLEFIYGNMVFNTHCSKDHLSQMSTMIGPMPQKMRETCLPPRRDELFHSDGNLKMEDATRSPVQCKQLSYYVGDLPKLEDLVSRCLLYDPKERIHAQDMLKHPYLEDFQFDPLRNQKLYDRQGQKFEERSQKKNKKPKSSVSSGNKLSDI